MKVEYIGGELKARQVLNLILISDWRLKVVMGKKARGKAENWLLILKELLLTLDDIDVTYWQLW